MCKYYIYLIGVHFDQYETKNKTKLNKNVATQSDQW